MEIKEFFKQCLHLLDNWVNFQVYSNEVPGVSIGLFVEDEIIFSKQYGHANLENREKLTKDHLFRIASHSKLFTATAIMQLYHQERLSIDDKVVSYLPWFYLEDEPKRDHIRIRHLLSHASGMSRDGETGHWGTFEFPDLNRLKKEIAKPLMYYDTNQHLKYSNYAFTILGQIIEKIAELDYSTYINTHIFDPLGMNRSVVDVTEHNIPLHATGYKRKFPSKKREEFPHVPAKVMQAATGLSSTVDDLIKFYRGHFFGNNILFPDYIKREMQTPRFKADNLPVEFGLGFSLLKIGELQIMGHGGGYPGFISYSGMEPKKKIILVVLTNAVDGPANQLFTGIMGLVFKLFEQKEKFVEVEEGRDFSDIVGTYMSDWGPRLYSQVGQLLVSINPDLVDPTEQLQIYEYKKDKTFIAPPSLPYAEPGQPTEFIVKDDGRTVVRSSGVEIERFEIPF